MRPEQPRESNPEKKAAEIDPLQRLRTRLAHTIMPKGFDGRGKIFGTVRNVYTLTDIKNFFKGALNRDAIINLLSIPGFEKIYIAYLNLALLNSI